MIISLLLYSGHYDPDLPSVSLFKELLYHKRWSRTCLVILMCGAVVASASNCGYSGFIESSGKCEYVGLDVACQEQATRHSSVITLLCWATHDLK